MSRWAGVMVLALLSGGCVGDTLVENTPPPTPAPPPPVTIGMPPPLEAAAEAPPPPQPRPRNPNPGPPGPNAPPGGGNCGTPDVSIDRPGNGDRKSVV